MLAGVWNLQMGWGQSYEGRWHRAQVRRRFERADFAKVPLSSANPGQPAFASSERLEDADKMYSDADWDRPARIRAS